MGVTSLGLHSARNVGLLLHLLGLKVPDGALTGLDGVLIGLGRASFCSNCWRHAAASHLSSW